MENRVNRRTSKPWDVALAVLLVLGLSIVRCPSIEAGPRESVRRLSLRMTEAYAKRLRRDPSLNLIILGDSRSRVIDVDRLCSLLPAQPARCFNASTTSGDWVTAWILFRDLHPRLGPDARVLIFVSDYWLEGPDTGLLPRTTAYAELGQRLRTLESFIPASAHRSARMDWLRESLEDIGWRGWAIAHGGGTALAKKAAAESRQVNLFRSNVDQWFMPISEKALEQRRQLARRFLEEIRAADVHATLVHLPNLMRRDAYVDKHYPGRRDRFEDSLEALSREVGIELIDLRRATRQLRHYKDFHHLNAEGIDLVTRRLARRLTHAVDEPRFED
jgi:hypothetical protein